MRSGPFPRMQDRLAHWQNGAQLPRRWQTLHSFPPLAKRWEFRIHHFAFLRETERERGWQHIEVGERGPATKQIVLSVRQLALYHAEPKLTFGKACATTFSSEAIPSSGKTSRSCVTW